MPKKKGKKGGKKKGKGLEEKEGIAKKTRELHKQYLDNCASMESAPGATVVATLTQCLEEEKPFTKVRVPLYSSWLGVSEA